MDIKKRIITVVLDIQDSAAAQDIWERHLDQQNLVGCTVLSIANGNALKQLSEMEEELDYTSEDWEVFEDKPNG